MVTKRNFARKKKMEGFALLTFTHTPIAYAIFHGLFMPRA